MANLNGMYNPEAEPNSSPDKLPSGEYLAQIVESDMKPTRSGGEYLELTYEVIEGEFKGRRHWERLNLVNASDKVVEIANRQFASIREVTGVMNPRTSEELHYKPHVIRIQFDAAGTTDRKGNVRQYDEATIKAWKKADAGTTAASPSPAPAVKPAAPWDQRVA